MDDTLPPEFEQEDSVAAVGDGDVPANSCDQPAAPESAGVNGEAASPAAAEKAAEEAAALAGAKLKAMGQVSWELQIFDMDRAFRVAAFNRELGERLASLNRGQRVDPILVQYRFREKSAERRRHDA
jgi:hypothetical protein